MGKNFKNLSGIKVFDSHCRFEGMAEASWVE